MSEKTEPTLPELPRGIAELATAAENARLRYEMLSAQQVAPDPAERAMQSAHYEKARQEHTEAQNRLRDACAAAIRSQKETG